jgi:hypothetical protein
MKQKSLKSLQKKLPYEREIDRIFVERYPCSNNLPRWDQTPINVHIPGRAGQFIDVADIKLVVHAKIKSRNQNGQLQTLTTERVLPLCLFLHTMFESLSMDINHKPFLRTYEFYGLLKYVQNLLYAPKSEKETILRSALWYRDAPTTFTDWPDDGLASWGAFERRTKSQLSALMCMQGKLDLEPFVDGKPLVEGVDLDLTFVPAIPKKCLLGQEIPAVPGGAAAIPLPPCVVWIEKFELLVPRIQPKAALLKQIVSYNYTKREVF